MSDRHRDRVVVVTGGAAGIGAAIAARFVADGATVVVGDLKQPTDTSTGGVRYGTLDVTSPDSVDGFINGVVADVGRLDVVVNNAGIMFEENIDRHSLQSWETMIAVNLTGPFLMCRAAVPHLKQRGGAIVNVGSIEGFSRNPHHAAYSASKAGVHGLTGALAVDLGPFGIRANAVAPGWIDTKLNASYVDSHPDRELIVAELAKLHPLGKIGDPSDVADVVSWLASDDASFVTGQVITIDGGRLSRPPLPGILS